MASPLEVGDAQVRAGVVLLVCSVVGPVAQLVLRRARAAVHVRDILRPFSNSMFAEPILAKSQPARVKGTHGAGVLMPIGLLALGGPEIIW
jgi:hypothetical protein